MYGDFPSGQGSQAIWKEAYLGSVSSSVAIVRLCGTVERMRVDWWRFECVALCRGTVLMVLGSNRLFRRWIVMKWVVSGLFKYTSTLNWWCSLQGTFAIINTTSKISSYRTFRNLGLRGPAFYHCLTMQWMLFLRMGLTFIPALINCRRRYRKYCEHESNWRKNIQV